MGVTYDLHGAGDIKVIARIRRMIGDLPNGETQAGVLPDGANFDDDEILLMYADEGNNVPRASAACLEAASNAWASWAFAMKAGSVSEDYKATSDTLAERARVLRDRFGYGDSTARARSAGFAVRVTT